MDKTQFAGLTRLAPGDPLSTDGYSFQFENPTITDNLLKVGARTHKHDGHAALADPTAPPDVTLAAGVIPAATEVGVCYTLVDAWGGETLPSDVEIVATPNPLPSPNTEPELAIDYDLGGSLVIGSYTYAIAVMDASGGVTPVGPSSTIERDPGFTSAKVTISGLSDIVAASSGYAWRAYKAMNQSQMHFLASGLANIDALVDDGTLCGNCTEGAPTTNTTGVSAGIGVVVPSGYTASAAAVRIYLGEDGDFSSPSFAEELTPAQAASGVTYATLAIEDGKPPDVATTVAGANQIDPDTDLLDWHWKRPVADAASLPTPAEVGDVRLALDTGYGYFYSTASAWVPIKGQGSGHVVLDDLTPMPPQPNLAFVGADVTDDPANNRTLVTITAGSGGTGSGVAALPEEVFEEAVDVDVAIPDNAAAVQTPDLAVSGDGKIGDDYSIQVELYVTHTYDSDLDLQLVAPDATVIDLVTTANTVLAGESNFGTGWTAASGRVSFAADAPGIPPHTTNGQPVLGHFRPEEPFNVLDGMDIAGNWKLQAKDNSAGDTGTIRSWGLRFTLKDEVRHLVLLDDDVIESLRTADGRSMGKTFYRRGRARVDISRAVTHADWTYASGNSTYPPPSAAVKAAYYEGEEVAVGNPLVFVPGEYAEILFPVAWTTFANFGTIKIGFEDADGNFVYAQLERSSTSMFGQIGARRAADPANLEFIHSPNIFASMVGKTQAWIRFVRWRHRYYVELWDVEPGSTSVTINPLARTSGRYTPNNDGAEQELAFGVGGKEVRARYEYVPSAGADTTIPANIQIRGEAADSALRELVTVVGDPGDDQSERALEVLASSRGVTEYAVPAYDSGFTQFVRYHRDRDGMVHVHFSFSVDNGTPRVNLVPPPPLFKPLRTSYTFWVPHSTGGTGETVTLDQHGNIVRDTPSPGALKNVRGMFSYPAYDAAYNNSNV